ncbi:Isochorismatase hydrolase [Hypomontagnella monticulosa]|nr:Isochorismatase hydrolase [Hypomontagnella monticulosa]
MNFVKASRCTSVRGLRPRPIASLSPPIFIRQSGQKLFSTTIMAASPQRYFEKPALFICDMQEVFRKHIWQFDKILLTTQKMLEAAQILNIPVYVTTQNAAKLGDTVPELKDLTASAAVVADKTAFSMLRAPELAAHFPPLTAVAGKEASEVVIVGIESHICVTQTSLDLLARGHRVYVLADGVSSCNPQEIDIALARLRAAGAVVTTSESWIYQCMGDAAIPEFKGIAKLVAKTKADTKSTLETLLGAAENRDSKL